MTRQCTAQQFTSSFEHAHHQRLTTAATNTIFHLTDSNRFLPPFDSATTVLVHTPW